MPNAKTMLTCDHNVFCVCCLSGSESLREFHRQSEVSWAALRKRWVQMQLYIVDANANAKAYCWCKCRCKSNCRCKCRRELLMQIQLQMQMTIVARKCKCKNVKSNLFMPTLWQFIQLRTESSTGRQVRCQDMGMDNSCGLLAQAGNLLCRVAVASNRRTGTHAQTHNKCSNAQVHKCTNAQMHKCTNAQMLKCTNAQVHMPQLWFLHKWSNAQMLNFCQTWCV